MEWIEWNGMEWKMEEEWKGIMEGRKRNGRRMEWNGTQARVYQLMNTYNLVI